MKHLENFEYRKKESDKLALVKQLLNTLYEIFKPHYDFTEIDGNEILGPHHVICYVKPLVNMIRIEIAVWTRTIRNLRFITDKLDELAELEHEIELNCYELTLEETKEFIEFLELYSISNKYNL